MYLPRHIVSRRTRLASRARGFTLIELSIVIVVIALIAAGIIIGKDMIRQYKLRNITKRAEEIRTAVHTFKLKYNGLPGDLQNATQFWGTDPGGCPATAANTTIKTATCNGNNNGWIDWRYFDGGWNYNEPFRFWQHLANAGLIAGQYSGTPHPEASYTSALVDVNIPPEPWGREGAFGVQDFGLQTGTTRFVGQWGNTLFFSQTVNVSGYSYYFLESNYVSNGMLYPAEAYGIDKKFDDGMPGLGKIFSRPWSCSDADGSSPATTEYNYDYTLPVCGLMFVNAF